MTDVMIKGTVSLRGTVMDWLVTPEGLSEEEELATIVRLALGTDALADEVEALNLPNLDSTDRKGWWGDMDAQLIWDGWPIGCKNWLLLRDKIADYNAVEGATVLRAERYTYEALVPLINKRVASAVKVRANRVGKQQIDVHVTIYRGPLRAVELRFAYLWGQVIDK